MEFVLTSDASAGDPEPGPIRSDPAREYRERLRQRRSTHQVLSGRDARLSYSRLVLFGLFLLLLALAWRGTLSYAWLVGPVALFGWLVQWHDRIIRERDSAARAILFYERGIARIDDRWPGTGESGERFIDDHHLY